MIDRKDILHRTTYVWKEDGGYAIIIKNDGNKVILNKDMTRLWKLINDEDTIDTICNILKEQYDMSEENVFLAIQAMIDADIVSNQDMFWGDEIL